MELGQVIDFCDEWNQMNEIAEPEDSGEAEEKENGREEKRLMNQAEINAFLG